MSGNKEKPFIFPECLRCGNIPKYWTLGVDGRAYGYLYREKQSRGIYFIRRASRNEHNLQYVLNNTTYVWCSGCESPLKEVSFIAAVLGYYKYRTFKENV